MQTKTCQGKISGLHLFEVEAQKLQKKKLNYIFI